MLTLRWASEADCKLLWEWANNPSVRSASFSTGPIPWEVHVEWFASKLRNPDSLIFVASDEQGHPIGQVRFDVVGLDEAEVGVSLDESFRGKGYGTALIATGIRALLEARPVRIIHAYVKPDNQASQRVFEKAGFQLRGTENLRDTNALHYVFPTTLLETGLASEQELER
jgi:RimJ/RimL family protein N-acetyltransferase